MYKEVYVDKFIKTTAEKNTVAEFLSGKTKKHGKRTGRCDIKCF